jgi:hypothetical protein
VLREDVVGTDGLDEGLRAGDVGVVQGGGDEEDAHAGQVFDVLLEQDGVAWLEELATGEGDDVAAIIQIGAAVYGEVGVAVQGALRRDGDPADLERLARPGDDEARLGEAEAHRLLYAIGRHDVRTGRALGQDTRCGLAEVVAVLVGDEDDVEHRGQVGRGNG